MSSSRRTALPGWARNHDSRSNSRTVRLSSPSVQAHPARATVEFEVAVDRRSRARLGGAAGGGCSAGTAQDRLHAQHQFARAEGLGEIVVGADLEPADAVVLLAEGGQHHDRQIGSAPAEPPAHLEAVDAGEHEVEHHDVGRARRGGGQGVDAVRRAQHRHAGALEIRGDDVADGLVVIDDQSGAHATQDRRGRRGRAPRLRGLPEAYVRTP